TKGLRRLACEERHGMVWVTPDPDVEAKGMADWLGPELDELNNGRFQPAAASDTLFIGQTNLN
ncbi:MAG: hypothetical protein AAFZ09_13800, partial [Pseudomonadota bacterium]